MSTIHQVTDKDDYDSQLSDAGSKLVVAVFAAEHCGPWKAMIPLIEQMAQEKKDTVTFLNVDIENCNVSTYVQVAALPGFVFYKNSEKVDDFCGANFFQLKEYVNKNQ